MSESDRFPVDPLRAFVENLATDSTVAGECVHCMSDLPPAGTGHKVWCVTRRARAALASPAAPRPTHGRHCPCSACAREDWTNPDLAHCGMHGPSCPRVYAPLPAAPRPLDIEDPFTGEKWDGPAFDAGFKWGIQHERESHVCSPAAPRPEGLDVDDLAYAIAAAEGFPGWTPWSGERTNAALIAEAYHVIHDREPGEDRADAAARLSDHRRGAVRAASVEVARLSDTGDTES